MTALPPADCHPSPTDPWWRQRAAWIYQSILSGKLAEHDADAATTYRINLDEVGRLRIPDGRFVAADPYVMPSEPTAFEQTFAGETVDVFAARAVISADHRRVAALILKGSDDNVTSWSMATVPGQTLAP